MAAAAAPAVPREVVEDLEAAIRRACAEAPLVCVAGSIFLVGDVRGWLLDQGAETEA
jgi:folylpolyglutamate synthase/dihydropteroate synthase